MLLLWYTIIKGSGDMPDYKKLYLSLFNDVSKAIDQLEEAQKRAEELYIQSDEPDIKLIEKQPPADREHRPETPAHV